MLHEISHRQGLQLDCRRMVVRILGIPFGDDPLDDSNKLISEFNMVLPLLSGCRSVIYLDSVEPSTPCQVKDAESVLAHLGKLINIDFSCSCCRLSDDGWLITEIFLDNTMEHEMTDCLEQLGVNIISTFQDGELPVE